MKVIIQHPAEINKDKENQILNLLKEEFVKNGLDKYI
jgi:hypothetical protein